jgi:hypothetical protein
MDMANAAQRATIARDYSGTVLSWTRKTGEYSDEARVGYAMIAELSTGLKVTVGRYGAVLAESRG